LANIYIASCDAATLGGDGGALGLNDGVVCYVSMRCSDPSNPFEDVTLHEAAHAFHNCKRSTIGLRETRRREWLLNIAFSKRETFAYACETYSRILALANSSARRRRLLAEVAAMPSPSDERVDASEYLDILAEAIGARNGWRRILQRCAPP
jgi:hypothetical protein